MRITRAFFLSAALSTTLSMALSVALPTAAFSQEADVSSTASAAEAAPVSRGGFFSGIGEALGRVAAAPVKAARDLADGAQRGWSSDRSASSQQSAHAQSASPQSVSTALASAAALAKTEQSTLSANAVPSQGAARTSQVEFVHTRGTSEQSSAASSSRKARATSGSGVSGKAGAAALSGKQDASAGYVLVSGYREKAAPSQVPLNAAATTTSQPSAQVSAKASAAASPEPSAFDRAVASVRDAAIGKQAPAVIEDLSFRASNL